MTHLHAPLSFLTLRRFLRCCSVCDPSLLLRCCLLDWRLRPLKPQLLTCLHTPHVRHCRQVQDHVDAKAAILFDLTDVGEASHHGRLQRCLSQQACLLPRRRQQTTSTSNAGPETRALRKLTTTEESKKYGARVKAKALELGRARLRMSSR